MNRLLMFIILGLALAVTGCQKKEEPSPPKTSSEEIQKPATDGSVAMTDQAKQERNEFVSKLQKEMDELNTKLTEFRSTAQTATGEAKVKIDQQIQSVGLVSLTGARHFLKLHQVLEHPAASRLPYSPFCELQDRHDQT